MDVNEELERLHGDWFGENPADGVPDEKIDMWFSGDEETDRWLEESFGDLYESVTKDDVYPKVRSNLENRRRTVGLILLLDQLSRNLYRGEPEAFSQDERAGELARQLVRSGDHEELSMWERTFVYLPFEHSENRDDQRRSVELFEALVEDCPDPWKEAAEEFLDYARKHREVIEEFGRFPHRNEILGRESTDAEQKYLEEPGSGF